MTDVAITPRTRTDSTEETLRWTRTTHTTQVTQKTQVTQPAHAVATEPASRMRPDAG